MKHSLFVLAMVASMLVAAPFAHATIINYTASLSGPNESPANGSPGTGFALVTIDDLLNTMTVSVRSYFRNLFKYSGLDAGLFV